MLQAELFVWNTATKIEAVGAHSYADKPPLAQWVTRPKKKPFQCVQLGF